MLTLGFAECMPESDDRMYYVEWLENQQLFPPLSSTTTSDDDHDAKIESRQDEWHFLHRQEILQAQEDFPSDDCYHQLKTYEMEDTWQQVDILREKQFADVAAKAMDLPQPSKIAPIKPQRQRSPVPKRMTAEQQRHFYWEMIDRLNSEENMDGGTTGDFYDLYYDRKTHSNHKNNSKYGRRYHMEIWKRWHHRLEVGDLWANGKKIQRVMDYMNQQQQPVSEDRRNTNDKVIWDRPPALNPRLIHTLVMPRHHHHVDRSSSKPGSSSKIFKSLMEPDFCLQVKNG